MSKPTEEAFARLAQWEDDLLAYEDDSGVADVLRCLEGADRDTPRENKPLVLPFSDVQDSEIEIWPALG